MLSWTGIKRTSVYSVPTYRKVSVRNSQYRNIYYSRSRCSGGRRYLMKLTATMYYYSGRYVRTLFRHRGFAPTPKALKVDLCIYVLYIYIYNILEYSHDCCCCDSTAGHNVNIQTSAADLIPTGSPLPRVQSNLQLVHGSQFHCNFTTPSRRSFLLSYVHVVSRIQTVMCIYGGCMPALLRHWPRIQPQWESIRRLYYRVILVSI